MPSATVEMKYLENLIKFCTNSKIPFATKSLNKIPKECDVKTWIASASTVILNEVTPNDFWKEYSLESPAVPNSLSQDCDDGGLNVLLLILWSSFSDITHNAIVTCLKSGLSNWKCSELFLDVHWVGWYIKCICQYLRYYSGEGSKVMKEKEDWTDYIDSTLSLECYLLGQVVKYTSEFFRILVNPQAPHSYVTKFIDLLRKNEVQVDIHKLASPKK